MMVLRARTRPGMLKPESDTLHQSGTTEVVFVVVLAVAVGCVVLYSVDVAPTSSKSPLGKIEIDCDITQATSENRLQERETLAKTIGETVQTSF